MSIDASRALRNLELHRDKTLLAALLSLVFPVGLLWLHPRIDIADVDAFAYVVGSYSIQSGNGYRDLSGQPLNTWPPGYSLVLAAAPDPLTAALVINYIALGVAVSTIFLLARQAEWSVLAALGLATALGSGFLRILATIAHPDILTYAVFLVSVGLHRSSRPMLWVISYGFWVALIPFKLIALVFAPAAVLADLRSGHGPRAPATWKTAVVTGVFWTATLAGIVAYNQLTMGEVFGGGHPESTPTSLVQNLTLLVTSIPRSLIAAWYGSIGNPVGLGMFGLMLAAGVAAVLTLRPSPDGGWIRYFGVGVVGLSLGLLLVRHFDAGVRLMAYGLIPLLLSFKPRRGGDTAWVLYGLAALSTCLVNLATVNSFGANDPRYQELAREVAAAGVAPGRLLSNSFHLLDVHERITSLPIYSPADLADQPPGTHFLWITLPPFDAIATVVTPMNAPGSEWQRIWEMEGAALFRRRE